MKLDSISATTTVTNALRDLIVGGSFKSGAPLRQDHLASHLKVSRTPLRHALRALVAEGLVKYDDFRGAHVARIDPSDINDVFEMRLMLEKTALASAFPALTKVDLAKAEIALDQAASQPAGLEQARLNWGFHSALYLPCGRTALLKVIDNLNRSGARAEIVAASIAERPDQSAAEHLSLLMACQKGQLSEALNILNDHLISACKDTLVALSQDSHN